ncbi:MAG TPA: glucans biosynthesis glucosyltransferase MdoH [Candidatus Acidoferrum sp.]|nr:glucans biosynthesis glucosyltransferase MdoH [Candidatus Acidoferrum sp.]
MTSTARLALPPEQPLAMPRQLLQARNQKIRSPFNWWEDGKTWLARLLLIVATYELSAYGITEMTAVMTGELTRTQWVFLVLFSINFIWISFAGCQAVLGFLLLLKQDIFGTDNIHDRKPGIRTAVLAPVYNEDPIRVAAGIKAMSAELARQAPGCFTFFILSDTTNPTAWLREENTFRRLIDEAAPECPIYYRHRRKNSERKAGNISDWVMRWGGGYEAMLILDADSIMSGATMIEMARRLEADPALGLLQTLPSIVLGTTLYSRLQQFANRLYGPVFANGLAAWHGNGSNFWGHNAIIRTRAFAEAAHLPVLTGKPPFGGHVISHDFIEAAMLRRAGWSVRFDTDLAESYEESPPSMSDVLIRDRRWCQGNLQHTRFLFARGLRFTNRLHILSGIMAYASAVFWLLLLCVGLVLSVQASFTPTDYFRERSLFPTWPVFDSERAITLFVVSMEIVLLPKFLAWCSGILSMRRCFGFGGPIILTLSVLAEIALSALFAPVMMLAQSQMVREILTGSDSGWKPQRRNDGSISLGAALRMHFWHMALGLATAIFAWNLNQGLFYWLLPVTSGLMLSALLSWISGKALLGRILRWFGILSTPEERHQPEIIAAVVANEEAGKDHTGPSPLSTLLNDEPFRAWHNAQITTPLDANSLSSFEPELKLAQYKSERCNSALKLETWLAPTEYMALLHSPVLIDTTARLTAS